MSKKKMICPKTDDCSSDHTASPYHCQAHNKSAICDEVSSTCPKCISYYHKTGEPFSNSPDKDKDKAMKIDDKGGVTLLQIVDAQGKEYCKEFDRLLGSMIRYRVQHCLLVGILETIRYKNMKPWLDDNPGALEWLLYKGLLEEKELEKFYHIGQIFSYPPDGSNFLLSTGEDNYVHLANMKTGERWVSQIEVKDISRITETEFGTITHREPEFFTEVLNDQNKG